MASKKASVHKQNMHKNGGGIFPAICRVLGTLILLAVILIAIPLAGPRLMGYDAYSVVSGSMEPEIPVGSLVYTEVIAPEEVTPGMVIAFDLNGEVVIHRVVANSLVLGEFTTKGDANQSEDLEPVKYDALIGVMRYHFAKLGRWYLIFSTKLGKIYLGILAACGLMFHMLASQIISRRKEELAELEKERGEVPEDNAVSEEKKKKKSNDKTSIILRIVILILLIVFVVSAYNVIHIQRGYKEGEQLYEQTANKFVTPKQNKPKNGSNAPEVTTITPEGEVVVIDSEVPITVDFEALKAINPDIIGWIYCEGTVISYPVLHGATNDTYLRHSYEKKYLISGSIFIDAANESDWSDSNTIIYGHHMKDGSMFATLEKWCDQDYFDAHPVMYLLTPEQNYRIELFSAYTTSATSDTYTIYGGPGMDLDSYLAKMSRQSVVSSDVTLEGDAHYVVLSTCAYVFENARSVVHGNLVPIE